MFFGLHRPRVSTLEAIDGRYRMDFVLALLLLRTSRPLRNGAPLFRRSSLHPNTGLTWGGGWSTAQLELVASTIKRYPHCVRAKPMSPLFSYNTARPGLFVRREDNRDEKLAGSGSLSHHWTRGLAAPRPFPALHELARTLREGPARLPMTRERPSSTWKR